MKRDCSDEAQVVAGPPSNFATFDINLNLICEHSRHFQDLYCEGKIRYGMEESIMLPNLTPEFFRVYVDRLEGSSFDLAQAVNFETEAMEPSNVDSQVFERLHRLCTWWREADFLEDSELKNAIMDILVGQGIDDRSDVLSKSASLIAGEEMEESGLRLWWVEYMVTTLDEDNIEALCRELPKDILVDLLKAQVKLSKEGKVEDFRDRVRGGERYYEQDQGEGSDRS